MTYYRVVADIWAGFEVQQWSWWWPFWTQCRGPRCSRTNTHRTVEAAEAWAAQLANERRPVKYLGKLP